MKVLMITSGGPVAGQARTTVFLQRQADFLRRCVPGVIVVSDHMRAFVTPRVPVYTVPSGLDFDTFRLIPRDEARAGQAARAVRWQTPATR